MGHVGPHTNRKRKRKKKEIRREEEVGVRQKFIFYFFIFFFLTSLFDIRKSDRQNSSGEEAKCSTQRGLRVGTKNTGFHRVFNKYSENPLFWFFSDLRLSAGQNWSEQKVKLIHASRATHGHQNIGV